MASGKESPRQKMIGMMYLVLTALLALNVSKEIVNAFVKLNDKLEDSNKILTAKVEANFQEIKTAAGMKHTAVTAKPWLERATKVKTFFSKEFEYLLEETNALLRETEGQSSNWLETDKRTGNRKLKPLMEVQSKDDYDAATRLFVGGDPLVPNERGQQLKIRLHSLRDEVCDIIGTYNLSGKKYSFNSKAIKNYDPKIPTSHQQLQKALLKANPADTTVLSQVYKALSYPENLTEYGEKVSWQGAMFDHAPVVAAAAILTSLRTDIRTAEALTMEHFASKLGKIEFIVNKIEPVAFAPKGYLNVGDSMSLRVMIAAYDSNNVSPIQFAETKDLTNAQKITGPLTIKATSPGIKTIYGNIAVRQKNELVYKPWSFQYEVGEPTASISQTDLNILYAGIENNMAASASGYSQSDINLTGLGITISKKGQGGYIVNVPVTMVGQKVKLNVMAKGKNVGGMEFRVRSVPKPILFFGTIPSEENKISKSQLLAATNAGFRLGYDPSAPIINPFALTECEVIIELPGGPQSKPEKVMNGKIPASLKAKIEKLGSGAKIRVENARGTGKPGNIRVAGMSLTVQ